VGKVGLAKVMEMRNAYKIIVGQPGKKRHMDGLSVINVQI
jgi:hypothetical protein